MIALDTNILVYAWRQEAPHHVAARKLITRLAEGEEPWCIPWPCIYEYLRVVTHPRLFSPPMKLEEALKELDKLLSSPGLHLLGETPGHRIHLVETLMDGHTTGNLVHDGHIAALLREHGVREIWTTDRDFSRFPALIVRNPFVERSLGEPRRRGWTPSRPRRPTFRSSGRQRVSGAS